MKEAAGKRRSPFSYIRNTGLAGGMMAVAPVATCSQGISNDDFPLMDLHVHLTTAFTIDKIMEISKASGVQFGVVANPGGTQESQPISWIKI